MIITAVATMSLATTAAPMMQSQEVNATTYIIKKKHNIGKKIAEVAGITALVVGAADVGAKAYNHAVDQDNKGYAFTHKWIVPKGYACIYNSRGHKIKSGGQVYYLPSGQIMHKPKRTRKIHGHKYYVIKKGYYLKASEFKPFHFDKKKHASTVEDALKSLLFG